MNLALVSVFFGSSLTLAQVYLLSRLLDINTYVNARAIINTMNNLAPILCLGFDNGAPILKKGHCSKGFYWNLLVLNFFIFVVFLFVAISLTNTPKTQSIFFGISASCTLACTIVIANHIRSSGDTRKYFLSVNVYDRIVRTSIITGTALLLQELTSWATTVCIMSGIYALYVTWITRTKIDINYRKFFEQLQTSVPFIFASLSIVVVSRTPFYAAYFFDKSGYAAKLDFYLLISLFILIPALNQSKIQEAKSEANLLTYMNYMRQGWNHVFTQELFILVLMFTLAWSAVIFEKANISDIKSIFIPILSGMVLISSTPNYIQLICFKLKRKKAIYYSLVFMLLTLLIYTPKLLINNTSTTSLFLLSATSYVLFGFFVAKKLHLGLNKFFRLGRTVFLIALLTCANLFI